MNNKIILSFILILFFYSGFYCNTSDEGKTGMQKKPVKDVIGENSQRIMSVEGVVGIYEGQQEDGTSCIKVMVIEDSPELTKKIPKEIEGYPVIIEVTGEIKPM